MLKHITFFHTASAIYVSQKRTKYIWNNSLRNLCEINGASKFSRIKQIKHTTMAVALTKT